MDNWMKKGLINLDLLILFKGQSSVHPLPCGLAKNLTFFFFGYMLTVINHNGKY